MSRFMAGLKKLDTKQLLSVDLPDWEVEPEAERVTAFGKVFYAYPLTMEKLRKADKYSNGSKAAERAYILIYSLLNTSKKPELSISDKAELLDAPSAVIDDVYRQINRVGGNLPATRTVYFKPVSLNDNEAVRSLAGEDMYLFSAHLFILKALDEHGNRLFSEDDLDRVMAMNVEIVNSFVLEVGRPRSRADFLE